MLLLSTPLPRFYWECLILPSEVIYFPARRIRNLRGRRFVSSGTENFLIFRIVRPGKLEVLGQNSLFCFSNISVCFRVS